MASLSIAAPTAAARNTKTTQSSIKQLNELLGKSAQDFVKIFINNLTFIDSQEKLHVRDLLEKRRVSTLQSLRSALQGKVASLIPSHTILKKELSNDKPNLCNDIMELFPLSYISPKSIPLNVDKNNKILSLAQTTEDVTILDASVATASGCSNCVKTDNPTRVAELEQKVAALEQEVATYKQILTLAAGSPGCGVTCNTALLEQKIAVLDQRCSVIEQWTIPSLSSKESELNKLLKPLTTLTPLSLAPKPSLITEDGKDKKSVIVTPANTKPPVAAPRSKSLPSPVHKPTPIRENGPLAKVPQTVKKVYLFIANCDPSYTRNLVREHINSSTESNLLLSDIVELNTKNRRTAFKVAVPENKKDIVLSIWQAGIKAEPYRNRKPPVHQRNSFRGLNSYTSNKSRNENSQHQRRPSHKTPHQTHKQYRQHTHRQSQNQPYRRDSDWMGDYQDWCPYRYEYQEQHPVQYYNYRWGSSYRQPEQRSYSHYPY